MLSEKQLNDLLAIFLERMQSVTEEYLIRMGEHIQEIGQLIPSDINRLVQLKRLNANMDAIKREIARIAEISAGDLEKIFVAAAEMDARFVAEEFGNEFKVSILESEHIQQILEAQLNVTLGEMQNISRTTIDSTGYRQAVDRAIQAVQSGIGDYKSAIRRALAEAAGEGLRITYPNGYSRRLDSAIRQNVLDGIRSLNNDVLWQVGEEYGADGVEISAHALCAEDHLPYQGRQFSKEAFMALQEKLPRPFGMWNCKHSIHPILLGISEPAYADEELDAYKRNSEEKIEINGVTKTRYEWTQQQRRIETAVRTQKDVAIAAQAAGDMKLRRTAQQRINALYASYDIISEKADIETVYDRMFVSGFKPLSEKQLKNAAKSGIVQINTKASGDGVKIIATIDNDAVKHRWPNIKRDVVLTEERIAHIREGHEEDYAMLGKYISQAIKSPSYILADSKNKNTAMFIKHVESTNMNVVVRLAFNDSDAEMLNSVITMYRLGDKTLKRLIKKNPMVYKSEQV